MKKAILFKALALTVVLALFVGCFAACGDDEEEKSGSNGKKTAAAQSAKPKKDKTPSKEEEKGDTDDNKESGDEKQETQSGSKDEKDTELEKLKSMSSQQIADEIFKDALEVYSLFDGCSPDYNMSQKLDKNGYTYYKVKSTQENFDSSVDFSSYDEFKKFVGRYFSTELIDKLLEEKLYINVDGDLYTIPVGRGGNMSYHSHSFAVTSAKTGEIEYTAYLKTIKDEYMDRLFEEENFEPTEEMLQTTEIKYNYKKIDGNWVFTSFQSLL